MFKTKVLTLVLASTAVGAFALPSAFAQGTTTFYDPYVPGVQITPPLLPPAAGPMVAPGSGPTPPPVTPGMPGPAESMPWIPTMPVNSFGGNTGLSLPIGPQVLTPPGVLGPALSGFIPPPASAPGPIPPYLDPQGGINPSQEVQVPMGGVLPGTGGYYGSMPRVRKGGQKTLEFARRELPSIMGGGGPNQDSVTLMGPLAGYGTIYGIPTGEGYNNGPAGSNNDLRQTSVDLGGGARMKVGNQIISTNQSIQDYGNNVLRTTPIGGITARQSTDMGQGVHGSGVNAGKTTDFGGNFQPFNPANIGPGTRDPQNSWLLPPQGVETSH
jgi:hypothetical protein